MDFPVRDEALEAEMYEDEDTLRQRKEDKLQAFGASLASQRDEWIRSRYSTGVDKRWLEDVDQYHARHKINRAASQMMTSVEQGYPVTTQGATPHRSTVYIGLTRQKTNAAEARLADILLPTDDRNWGIQPSPLPVVFGMDKSENPAVDPRTGQQMLDRNGQPLLEKDMVRAIREMADERAKAMQTQIDDQLMESDYNSEVRKMIHDAAMLGTGVIKGPIVTSRTRKAWQPQVDAMGEQVQVIEIVEEINPASFRVDPRNVWPDPGCGEDIHTGKGIYERDLMTAKQVRELAKQPGYMKEQLRKVLEEGPKQSATMVEITDEQKREQYRNLYEVWTYWGEVEHEDLESAGVEVGERDELRSISGCVVFVNNVVVKAFLNPLETGDIPYDFYPWEKVSGSVWGFGIPYLMRAQQKVLNAAWRQMMDNSGVSSGPQIVLKPGVIQPADKQWQLSSRKIWYATDDIDDVRKAFTAFEFNSHQEELASIIEMASKLADEETGMPMMIQGEKGTAPDTVGGMQMLMNASNVVLRRLVKQFDDFVTKPHIRRYYDYNMMYSDREDIKGDFNIDARGTSALLIRDIQNQAFLNLLAAGTNPVYGPLINQKKLFEKALQAQHIDPVEILKTDEQIQAEQQQAAESPQAQDPAMAVAQMRIEGEQAKIQTKAQVDTQLAQMKAEAEYARLQTQQQLAMQEAQFRVQEMQLTREIEMLKLAQTKELTLEQIKASLADTAIKERGKKELFAAETQLKHQFGSGI